MKKGHNSAAPFFWNHIRIFNMINANEVTTMISEAELKRMEIRATREEKLANVYERTGRIQSAITARKIAARLRQEIKELEHEEPELDDDEMVRVGSYRWTRNAERED